jgi:cellulose synthase/poly-beta-1,6-N-acetylglucosamine synthase-like glycosyltransferase
MILLALLLLLCTVYAAYVFVFGLAGYLSRPPAQNTSGITSKQGRFAVLVPAYKEDAVIVSTAKQLLEQQYPYHLLEIVVIADSLQAATLDELTTLPIHTLPVHFDTSTKSKAINAALAFLEGRFGEAYFDYALVLDADNHLAYDFVTQMNRHLQQGARVVQGHRVAKNTDSPTALLDAVSEELNNHIFRKGHRALGLSAALIGSGMAFEYALFASLMAEIKAIGGFDKELEMRLLSQGIVIEYAEEALCYDEKVRSSKVFERQRTRWLAAQWHYLKRNTKPGLIALFKGNFDYFDKVFQAALPPRLLLLALSTLGWLLALGFGTWVGWATAQVVLLGLGLLLAAPWALVRKMGWKEWATLPTLLVRFVKALFRINEAKKKFIHTPHG